MFIKGIKRNYDKINADESIADEDKIDALLMKLGAEFLVSKEDRVYIFKKGDLEAKFDAKHARAYHFKEYVCKDMNKLFHGFWLKSWFKNEEVRGNKVPPYFWLLCTATADVI